MTMQEHFDRLHGHLIDTAARNEKIMKDPKYYIEFKEHLFEIIRNYNAILRLAGLSVEHKLIYPDEE